MRTHLQDLAHSEIISAEDYALAVLDGRILACDYIKLACDRYFNDREKGELRGIYFDEEKANRVIDFYSLLKHYKGEWVGQKFVLEPFQKFIIWNLFGFQKERSRKLVRRFTEAYVEMAKKNGKTLLGAGGGLFMLYGDGEAGSEVYCAASTRDQARRAFEDAQEMVRKSGGLDSFIRILAHSLMVEQTASSMRPLPAEADAFEGKNPHCVINDEFHVQKNWKLYNNMKSAMMARIQPLFWTITTAGYNMQGPCYQLRKRGINVLSGTIKNDSLFPLIYTLDKDDDWQDNSTWGKANPCLGTSVIMDKLLEEYNSCIGVPELEYSFKTKNLNMWVNSPDGWVDLEVVKANSKGVITDDDLEGRKCYGGLDIGTSDDLTAFALLFVNDNHKPFAAKFWFWVPSVKVKNDTTANYKEWSRDNWIKEVPGRTVDHDVIVEDIYALAQKYDLEVIGYDPYKVEHTIKKGLGYDHEDEEERESHQGFGLYLHAYPQNTKHMGVPSNDLRDLLSKGADVEPDKIGDYLELFRNPVIEWMFGNVVIYKDTSNNPKPDRKRSENKIDGVSALVNAFGEWITFKPKDNDVQVRYL